MKVISAQEGNLCDSDSDFNNKMAIKMYLKGVVARNAFELNLVNRIFFPS